MPAKKAQSSLAILPSIPLRLVGIPQEELKTFTFLGWSDGVAQHMDFAP